MAGGALDPDRGHRPLLDKPRDCPPASGGRGRELVVSVVVSDQLADRGDD
jgi:hypothetical protein